MRNVSLAVEVCLNCPLYGSRWHHRYLRPTECCNKADGDIRSSVTVLTEDSGHAVATVGFGGNDGVVGNPVLSRLCIGSLCFSLCSVMLAGSYGSRHHSFLVTYSGTSAHKCFSCSYKAFRDRTAGTCKTGSLVAVR